MPGNASALVSVYECTYNMVEFEWDELKARSNRRKHGVDFADAVSELSESG